MAETECRAGLGALEPKSIRQALWARVKGLSFLLSMRAAFGRFKQRSDVMLIYILERPSYTWRRV